MKRALLVFLTVCLLTGCTKSPAKKQQTIFAMDTVMTLTVYGANCEQAVTSLQAMIVDLDSTWSVTRSDSLIWQLNAPAQLDLTQEEAALLERVLTLKERTGGLYDPQLYALCNTWGFYGQAYRVPTQEDIQAALSQKQWDLGGAMKGYCGEKAVALLDTLDVDYAILDLGGNIQTYQQKPDGTPWKIGIQNPDGGEPLGVLSVTGTMAVVTSGDYQRCFTADGKQYHHIIDPRTGYPAESGLRSVTVICKSGLTADCLSTALFVMGLEYGIRFWQDSADFDAVFVTTDGSLYATEGIALSGCEYEVIHR